MRKNSKSILAIAWSMLVFSGCSNKQILSGYVITMAYNGNYNGFEVGILDKKFVRKNSDGVDTSMSSIECNMLNRSNKDSPWGIIHGEDRNYDGQWDIINVTAKTKNSFYRAHPRDLIDARNNLDAAVMAAGNEKCLIND